jgi:hypothetical protein
VQLSRIAYVDVERGRTGVELLRQTAHGDPLEAFGPHQGYGGLDDAVPGQGRFRRSFATAGAWRGVGAGVCCHLSKVTNMFATNKYVTNMFVDDLSRRLPAQPRGE